jgi:hypothetical protein
VVHSLPGRLRLHVPVLAQIPEEAPVDEYVALAMNAIEGVKTVEVSRASSRALIGYDARKLSERQIVDLVRSLLSQVVLHSPRFLDLDQQAQERFAERLRTHFAATRIRPGEEVRIPHDLWIDEKR